MRRRTSPCCGGSTSEAGFAIPTLVRSHEELAATVTFARQRSKLAGEIRGSFFVIKGEY